jgi:hypothetical protein
MLNQMAHNLLALKGYKPTGYKILPLHLHAVLEMGMYKCRYTF